MPNQTEALHLSGKGEVGDAVLSLAMTGPRVLVKLRGQGAAAADRDSWYRAGLPTWLQ
jgi:hypothetical protein